MKFSAKAILEYLETQEVKTEEDYERVLQFIKVAASKAKKAREARKVEKANNPKPNLKTKLQEAATALLAQIDEEAKDDNAIVIQGITEGDITENSVRIQDAMNDLHYLKGKREGIEAMLEVIK